MPVAKPAKRAPRSKIKTLAQLPPAIARRRPVAAALKRWKPGEPLWIQGVWSGTASLLTAVLCQHTRPLLVLTPDGSAADLVAADLESFDIPSALTLPFSTAEGTPESIQDQDYARRLQVLQQLRAWQPGGVPDVVTAPITAAIQGVPSPEKLEQSSRTLKVGQRIDVDELRQWLATAGFHASTAVELHGEFSMRGGILDVFAPDHQHPYRIELFGDEIDSIRSFDVASQRSINNVPQFEFSAVDSGSHSSGTLMQHLPAETAIVIVDPEACKKSIDALLARTSHHDDYLSWNDLLVQCQPFRIAMGTQLAEAGTDQVLDLHSVSVDGFVGDLEYITRRIDQVASDQQVIVVADTPADNQRMSELLLGTEVAKRGKLSFQTGSLGGGFQIDDPAVLVLTGAELFHRTPLRRVKAQVRSKPIDGFLQLHPGDLVVHLSHGIGLYRGLELLEKHGQKLEHLAIEFDGGTKIYVPATRIGLIQRYIGGNKSRPRLAKIGGQSWTKNKKAAESAVTDMASELLELQAQRSARRGIAFPPDSNWQRLFESSFPYTDTHDQALATIAFKESMESTQPMDRLICGDVGFGKTEVAMRAAFKAVDAGYQVAVLVPTTVLAEQHYQSFTSRMGEFPFDIGKLSRFASPEEQRETLKGIKSGRVDIVIGTHRVAGANVKFNNLGLVIIDEEQRFGVQVKERLKTKHSNVDVLTMSATPIPRTLHMAMVGVRDISNLETPPEDRLSVETRVTRWDEKLIHNAIVRELNRNGQIYFVHNRVNDIHQVAEKLKRIVPQASIVVGHGQMNENDLEQVMVDFIARKFDILLATTIIESGLDIPNANTIFIDEADRYGLSDLHQLRGRVGRYKHQAYCYMMIDAHKHLSPSAAKRMRAIEEFSQMGAGFAISMRDLEIRGAGNLLGTQQSGHIAAIGYELYCQLLESAVRQMKKLPPKLSADVDVDLPIEAYLPEDYVPDLRQKIDLYRRIARMEQFDELQEMREELLDRFGPLPIEVQRMMEIAELRFDAAIWQVSEIRIDGDYLVLQYTDRSRIEQLKRQANRPVRIVDDQQAYVPALIAKSTKGKPQPAANNAAEIDWLELARSILHLA
ncbi:transcription-repair coupling factor [Rosistilla oblonga]|uniref:transcription-repair coupling factor n=1 Tax=Rosistilla oblonga TaxID=2527990 RepID=UPI003A980225